VNRRVKMLLQLNISNFALIESLSISFDKGFNVLTGETGAGKSILIDAINYVLGGKFSKDLIRTGEQKTYVEAVFTVQNSKTAEVLASLDIEYDDLVIISRETFQSGKSIAKVNGKSLLLSNVKSISSTLLDIHGQHENQNLLESSSHIHYLDYFGGKTLANTLEEYKDDYRKLLETDDSIVKLEGKSGEREKLIDFYKYQIDEIDKANLKQDEDTELENEYSVLSNSEKIIKSLSGSYEILSYGSDSSHSIYDSLGMVIKDLRNVQKYIEKIKTVADNLEEAYYNIEEDIEEIRKLKSTIQYDEGRLEYINSRIYQIGIYKKKYGKTIKEILEYKNKIEKQYFELTNSSEIIEKLKKQKNIIMEKIKVQINNLNKIRCKTAAELENAVKRELDYVGLEKSTFNIDIQPQSAEVTFQMHGYDKK
jgi:DNA repair protein RecN (Recombination protein N)